jgi:hypothetical protein
MAEKIMAQSYCEVCGIDVDSQTNLRRFGKLFCSEEHLNQYVKSRQKRMGYVTDNEYDEVKEKTRRKRSWFGTGVVSVT